MQKENIFQEIGDAIEEAHRGSCPQIELHGWWWKKYIPHYRRMRSAMQTLLCHHWHEGDMKANLEEAMNQLRKEEFKRSDFGL